jgi:hypothetical protein
VVGIFGAVLLVSNPHGGGHWGAVAFTSIFINTAFLWMVLTAGVSVLNQATRRARQASGRVKIVGDKSPYRK